jgi:hypothetical protein
MCSDKKEVYKQELVKSFHQQFAENQNNHQSAFIQLLSIILTVIVGFSLALLNFGGSSINKDFHLKLFEFTIAFCIAEGILTLGFCLVVSYAYGFRRDQFVNATIREKAGITEESTEPFWQIFPTNYNPKTSFLKKNAGIKGIKKWFLIIWWMPDFHTIFAVAFILLQIVLMFSYILKVLIANLLFVYSNVDWSSLLIFVIGVFFLLITSFTLCYYFKKIKKLYMKKPAHNSVSAQCNEKK